MEYKIVDKEQLIIVGMNYYGDPFMTGGAWSVDNAIGKLWGRFMEFLNKYPEKISGRMNESEFYEFHIKTDGFEETGEYSIMIGVQVTSINNIPIELVAKVAPPLKYMVVNLKGEEIISDWPQIISTRLLPEAGYKEASNFSFELYDERFKGMDHVEGSEVDVYIPVEPIGEDV